MKKTAAFSAILFLCFCSLCPAFEIYQIALKGIIHPVTADFIINAVEEAEREEAEIFLLILDTPGGLETSMRDIITKIQNAKIPTVTYVAPAGARAASAGFLILLASDVAAMAPGTNTGAAHPVSILGFGEQKEDDTLKQKIEEDSAAYARTIARNHGRNAELAEKGVVESKSFTEQEALEGKLIDLIAKDRDDLLEKLKNWKVKKVTGEEITIKLESLTTKELKMNTLQEIMSFIANPTVAAFLLLIGLAGLYIEATHPGLIFPGVAGAVCLLLFAFAVKLLPVNILGILLIAGAVALFILEIKVTSYGFLTIAGIICLVIGSLILFDSDIPEMRVNPTIIIPFACAVGIFMAVFIALAVRAHKQKISTGHEALVGETGRAFTPIGKSGKVFTHGEYWNARSDEPIKKGEDVRIIGVRDLVLLVERDKD